MNPPSQHTRQEFAMRVLYSLLKPAVALADRFGVSMKDLEGLLGRAYYQRKRERGLTLPDMARELQVSTRTADRLAKSLRDNFFSPEEQHELPRRVEFLLWSGPRSLARLQQLLPEVSVAQLEAALESLIAEERAAFEPGRTPMYRATRRANRLLDNTMAARVDGLNHLLQTLQETVRRRFFLQDQRAGARTIGLRVRREEITEIERLYEEVLWAKLVELDSRAREANEDEVVEIGLALCWSPMSDTPDDDTDNHTNGGA
jgi:hypothetical protein